MRRRTVIPETFNLSASLATTELPPEPLGQRGIREMAGPLLMTSSLLTMFLAIAMLARSHFVVDILTRQGSYRDVEVRSVYGRLLVVWQTRADPREVRTWTHRTFPMPTRIYDPWVWSWRKALGADFGRGAPSGEPLPGVGWIRIKWSTIAVLTALLPVGHVLSRRLRRYLPTGSR